MPTTTKTITVTYDSGAVETYTVADADVGTITEGNILSFKGTLSGDSQAREWRIKGWRKYSITTVTA